MKKIRKDSRGRVLHRGESYIKKKQLFCYAYTDVLGKRKYDSEDLIEEMKEVAISAVESCKEQDITDISAIKSKVKSSVASFLFKKTKCSPIVLPVIFEV